MISWLKRIFPGGDSHERVTDQSHVGAAVEALASLQATSFDQLQAEDCLRQVQKAERLLLSADSYKLPYHFWWPPLAASQRKALAEGLKDKLTGELEPRGRLVLTALLVRFQLAPKPVEVLVDIAWRQHLSSLDADLAEELGALMHQQRAFPKLTVVCDFALKNLPLSGTQKQLFCDWYVQAAYQGIKGKIYRNILTPDHVGTLRDAVIRSEGVLGPSAPNVAHYRALLSCAERDLVGAVGHHVGGRDGDGYNTQFFRAALNLVPIAHMQALADGADTPATARHGFLQNYSFDMRHADARSATLVACDERYFDAYIAGFADSFAHCNPGEVLHIHAIAFTPDKARIEALEDQFDIRINLTLDPGPRDTVPSDVWRGYCAGARYIHLPAYLDLYERIIVNDIDGIVHTSMKAVWQGREGQVQLSTLALEPDRRGHFAFWSNIGAGAFGIEATDGHKRFAWALSRYLIERFDACLKTGQRFFFADQVGLMLAVLAFRDSVPMVRMPQVFRQSTQTAQAGRDGAKRSAQQELLQELKDRKPEGE